MADSISIVMKMNEDITGKMKSIASMSQGCSKELEELGRKTLALGERYQSLSKNAAKAAAQAAEVKKAMNEAASAFKKSSDAADGVKFEKLKAQYDELTGSAQSYQKMAKTAMREMTDSYETMRKLDAGTETLVASKGGGSESTAGGLVSGLMKAGLLKELGGSLSQAAGVLLERQPIATLASETASGALSGAAAGAMLRIGGCRNRRGQRTGQRRHTNLSTTGRCVYACRDKLSPEGLRDRLVAYGWNEVVMLDGGSTVFYSRDGGSWYCDSGRVLYSYLVSTLKKQVVRPTSTGAAGLALIKQFEGCRLKAYKPFAYEQYWTIGWGHYGADVPAGQTITQVQADAMLVAHLKKYEKYVLDKAYCPITASLTQNQFDALVPLCTTAAAGA